MAFLFKIAQCAVCIAERLRQKVALAEPVFVVWFKFREDCGVNAR
jgi:hypothetical protein